MPDGQDNKRQAFYNAAKAAGVPMPDQSTFDQVMNDPMKRRALYSLATSPEYKDKFPMPDYNTFESIVGSGFSSTGGQQDITRTPLSPNVKPKSRPLSEVVKSVTRPLGYIGNPQQLATDIATNPRQVAEDVGTSLEMGLPMIAAPIPNAPLRATAMGLLQGVGTGVKTSLMDLASGETRPLISGQDVAQGLEFASGLPMADAKKKPVGRESLASKMMSSTKAGILGAGAGELAGAGLQKAIAPFAGQVNKEALDISKKYGIKPLPSEVLEQTTAGTNFQKLLQDISSRSIAGSSIIGKQHIANFKAFEGYAKDVMDAVAPETAPSKMKEMVLNAVTGNENTFREVGGKMFAEVDQAASKLPGDKIFKSMPTGLLDEAGKPIMRQVEVGTANVPITQLKQFAQKLMDELPEQVQVAVRKGGQEASQLYKQINNILELPDAISFKDAQFYRSQLLTTIRAETENVPGQVIGSAKKLSSLFDTEMEKAAKAAGSDVYNKYRAASAFWKQGKDVFNHDAVIGLAKKDPEELAAYVFAPKSGETLSAIHAAIDPNTFRQIRSNVPDQVWQRFKRAGIENLIEGNVFQKVGSTGDPQLRGANLYQVLKNYGDETLNAWLSPDEKRALMKFAEMSARVSTKAPTIGLFGTGQVFQGIEALGQLAATGMGAGASAATKNPSFIMASTGVVTGLPAMYAKLITSDRGRKLLTEGYRLLPGSREAANFLGRFISYMNSSANKEPVPQARRVTHPQQAPVQQTMPSQQAQPAQGQPPKTVKLEDIKKQWGADAIEGYSDDELKDYLKKQGYEVQ